MTAVLTGAHYLSFGTKIGKIAYPCVPQFYYIKVGYKRVSVPRTSVLDDMTQFRFRGDRTFVVLNSAEHKI